MFDIVITGGVVIDGTGKPGMRADVGIKSERIHFIGNLAQAEARQVIDATGLIVCPGFIDTHVHSDADLIRNPQHSQGLQQGITTEILGQDGLSYAPLSKSNYDIYRRYLVGILGEIPEDLDMSTVSSFRGHYHKKTAINTVYLVPHGALRLETCGFVDVPMINGRLNHAQRLIVEGMEQGAVGFSTGLSYHPQAWSDTEEIVALCNHVKSADGVFVTHVRDVNTDRGHGGGGVAEALEIGRRTGVKIHISHYSTRAYDAGMVDKRMELIDEAKAEGVDVTAELYPYPTGSSFMASYIPSYAHEGGPDAIMQRLRNPTERIGIIDFLESESRQPLDEMALSYLRKDIHLEGMTLKEVACSMEMTLGEVVCSLLEAENLHVAMWGTPPASVAVWDQTSRDAMDLLARPDYMVGSDSLHVGRWPHPRAYGTFPRVLGRLRRRHGTLSLAQIVQRITDNPAGRFGLDRRGRIQSGFFADIVVFDPNTIMDNATYDDPRQPPSGISFVLVNGEVAVNQGLCTGIMAGQAIP